MAPRGRANTTGDMMGNGVDASDTSPSSTNGVKIRPPGSSASSVRSLRQRHSIFGRSSSDAGKARKLTLLHSSNPSQDSTDDQAPIPPRPRTALSTDQSSIRSRTKPFEAIRDSIFGGRRNGPTPAPTTRERADSSTLPTAFASAVPTWSREHFSNKDDYERHLTKQTISPPFNFLHVTHTEKAKLPALDTVDEKDLPGEFWSVSAYQRPRRHLHGIKAEDLRKKRPPREMSPISPISTNSHNPPVSPIVEDVFDDRPFIPRTARTMTPLDETMFDEISQTRFDPDDGALSLQPAKTVVKYPKRYSSLNALDELAKADAPNQNMNAFYESSSNMSEELVSRTVSPNTMNEVPNQSKQPPTSIDTLTNIPNFPLPPVPGRQPSQNQFKPPTTSTSGSNISLTMPQPTSPRSKRSSRSVKSNHKSPALSPHSDVRNSMTFSDDTWEDDVDFCYEQAAESTCDFNWDIISVPRDSTAQTDSSRLSITQSYHAVSPAASNDSGSSFRFNASSEHTETIATRRKSRASQAPSRAAQAPSHHKRGSSVASVGHRGFLAARKSSTDLTALANAHPGPAPISISPNPARVSVLSPVFSVTGADDESQKELFTPDALHFPRFDSVITENLSDPESCRNSGSSKHRKSSSYGSHESSARPLSNVAVQETKRWSLASVSSLPDLLHPRKSKQFLSKTIISSPLESLPQSPPVETDGAGDTMLVPRELQNQPVRNSFVMRRPQNSGDRAAMQAAGRMVQRRGARPETPKRFSRIIQTPDGLAVPEATKTGPQWI